MRFLASHNLTIRHVAQVGGLEAEYVESVLLCRAPITPRLAHALSVSGIDGPASRFWLGLQEQHDRARDAQGTGTQALMGVREVAQHLGCTVQNVCYLDHAGRLPPPLGRIAAGPVWAADVIRSWRPATRATVRRKGGNEKLRDAATA